MAGLKNDAFVSRRETRTTTTTTTTTSAADNYNKLTAETWTSESLQPITTSTTTSSTTDYSEFSALYRYECYW